MTSFWEVPSSTTGMRTGPRAGCSSGFLRRGSTYVVSVCVCRERWMGVFIVVSFICMQRFVVRRQYIISVVR